MPIRFVRGDIVTWRWCARHGWRDIVYTSRRNPRRPPIRTPAVVWTNVRGTRADRPRRASCGCDASPVPREGCRSRAASRFGETDRATVTLLGLQAAGPARLRPCAPMVCRGRHPQQQQLRPVSASETPPRGTHHALEGSRCRSTGMAASVRDGSTSATTVGHPHVCERAARRGLQPAVGNELPNVWIVDEIVRLTARSGPRRFVTDARA